MSDLATLSQRPGESVRKYVQRTREIERIYGGRIHFDKCLIRQQFVAGLRPPLKTMVRGHAPQTFEEAAAKAELLESA